MDMDTLPESMKLNFNVVEKDMYVAVFPFGEWMIVGPDIANTFTVGFILNQNDENKPHSTYKLDDQPKTLRAAKYIAQRFHVDHLIPKLVESFEVDNANSQGV